MTIAAAVSGPRSKTSPAELRRDDSAETRVLALASKAFGASPISVDKMRGGASTRSFFRVRGPSGQRAVGMFVPDAGRPEEISAVDENGRRWPFLEVRDLLASRGVRVPELLGEDCVHGVILVEDLGDDTLADFIQAHPGARTSIYQTAVRDLARAQAVLRDLPPGSIVAERMFDEALLEWEMHHFREWGLEARGLFLSSAERAAFDASVRSIASRIAKLRRVFVHRDYQSRNLMVVGPASSLAWVDFQDALLGPQVYDLVALLQDSYQSFTEDFIGDRLGEYGDHLSLDAKQRELVVQEFHLVSVQRKLKDAGRFVFIQHKKGDSSYLPFVEPTLDKVRRSLEVLRGDPDMEPLGRILDRLRV